jgi:hypothetical protein
MLKSAVFFTFALIAGTAEAQMVVTGGRSSSPAPVRQLKPTETIRSPRRERNRYFVARPIYPPAERGARANITFEPYTAKYYPTENSYYPPLPVSSTIRVR